MFSDTRSPYYLHFVTGLSGGFIFPFLGCVAITFFTASIITVIITVLSLSLAGAIIFGLARYSSEKEEYKEHNLRAIQEEYNKEQRILTKIGIPQHILEPMQKEMQEEQEERLAGISDDPAPELFYMSSLYLSLGYFTSGIFCSIFICLADIHLVIAGIMTLGVKFAAELSKNNMLKVVNPVIRTTVNILACGLLFIGIYLLFDILFR